MIWAGLNATAQVTQPGGAHRPAAMSPVARPAAAAPAAPPVSRPPIALIDVGYIMKHHSRLKQAKDAMLTDLKQAEAEMKQQRASVDQMKQQLRDTATYPPGSHNYTTLQQQIDMGELKIAQMVRQQRKDFVAREANIYYKTYSEIQQEARIFSQHYGFALVLNFNRSGFDQTKPETVVSAINQPVIYHYPEIDLTDVVLSRLDPSHVAGRPGNATH